MKNELATLSIPMLDEEMGQRGKKVCGFSDSSAGKFGTAGRIDN